MDPKSFDLEHWWKLLTAAGAAIATASIAVLFVPTILIGLGLIAVGWGEWINHPRRSRIGIGMGARWTVTGYPRRATVSGTLLSLTGGTLAIFGLVKLLLI